MVQVLFEGQEGICSPYASTDYSIWKDRDGHCWTSSEDSGNRYVLVVCDYATRYPESVALKSIDAEHVAEELIPLFARVGVPKEILTDQGSNFTSRLLEELYRLLHVRPIRTSPYHPQTDGLVERFNGTLNWDKWLPYSMCCSHIERLSSTHQQDFHLLNWCMEGK